MRLGIDVQVVASGNRSGLYNYLRSAIRELRPLVNEQLWALADVGRNPGQSDAARLSAVLDGAQVRFVRHPSLFGRLRNRFSIWNRVDVLLHNLHGLLPPVRQAANAYLVPDVIPLAVDYGVPGFADGYRPFYEAAAQHADVILVFTEHAKRDFLERVGGSPESVWVAPLAPGPEYRPVPKRENLRAALARYELWNQPYILMVSTLEIRKNHAVLLRAFARLVKRDPGLRHRMVLVGSKWIGSEKVFELITELRLEDRVTYVGFSEELPALYAGADAFVFPSLYEGFGLPPLEAMACGVPVLAAQATSLPEVVGDAGILFPPHDVDRLCDALHEVLTDRDRHDALAQHGLARAATFSWRRTAEIHMKAFQFGLRRHQDRTK